MKPQETALYRLMSVKHTPQETAISRATVGKTDTFKDKDLGGPCENPAAGLSTLEEFE